ncbi:hypothetical protein MJG53_016884 [Ovis ammon polii x Ovis aries]|uniref:Uncharacterized protein n=1 Tax=Ovis ammon polii x Ovis aries TaxID=2918886 RepID=A0ACB9UA71_9CETA|nr:hypothetical protein MJG53_016884 [Ovis ammon polii x Ovis aries]
MWTTATLSQPKLNVQLPTVREDSELEEVSVSAKTLWLDEKAGHDAEGGWEASDGGEDKDRFKPEEPEELELGGDSSQGSRLEEDDSKTDNGYQSEIGRGHTLTKQLQRYIEGLKRRRNRRLQVLAI